MCAAFGEREDEACRVRRVDGHAWCVLRHRRRAVQLCAAKVLFDVIDGVGLGKERAACLAFAGAPDRPISWFLEGALEGFLGLAAAALLKDGFRGSALEWLGVV